MLDGRGHGQSNRLTMGNTEGFGDHIAHGMTGCGSGHADGLTGQIASFKKCFSLFCLKAFIVLGQHMDARQKSVNSLFSKYLAFCSTFPTPVTFYGLTEGVHGTGCELMPGQGSEHRRIQNDCTGFQGSVLQGLFFPVHINHGGIGGFAAGTGGGGHGEKWRDMLLFLEKKI